MKLQYLGDSKDSFKWDYHHRLVTELGHELLTVAWMLTPDDKSRHGRTHPELFPGDVKIFDLCRELRASHDLSLVSQLPELMGERYTVQQFGADRFFVHKTRSAYFGQIAFGPETQVVFLDPDNGFEPPKYPTSKHVLCDDVRGILARVSDDSVVSVFHHFRHRNFVDDFAGIRAQLDRLPATALYWRSLMFVAVSRSGATVDRVRQFNADYSSKRKGLAVIS